ncbi:MAG: PQQ-binding-like beta-propeller repeat protein [Chitinophagaceae bacterium]
MQYKLSLFSLLILFSCSNKKTKNLQWPVSGGSKANIRYADLSQINATNVHRLTPAWEYHTGDADTVNHSQIQCNPLIIDGILYGTTPEMKLFAIDAATGKQNWIFNPFDSIDANKGSFFVMNNCRGISYWSDGLNDKRILYTAGSFLHCINANDGTIIRSFGDNGKVDLHTGLGRDVSLLFITATSPGTVYKDLIIMGSRVDEGPAAAPGHIRAFNIKTGKQEWIFHTIPQPGEPGHETWDNPNAYLKIGGANNWSGMSLDEARGIVYVPTGSASFDFYGGRRTGNNLYADCLLALDAATGKYIWHFQNIHHDVWDRDLPTAPALVTVTHNGQKTDAVAQPTKSGFVYLLDRVSGKPLFPVEEKAVPYDTELNGEKLSQTQPMPSLPKPFVRQIFTEADINNLLPDSSREEIRKRWTGYRKDHMFAPPSKQGTIVFPGFDGGAEWGGPAFDPETGMLYVNANEMPWVLTMVDKPLTPKKENYIEAGNRIYTQQCQACHGADKKGSGNFPSLDSVKVKYTPSALLTLLNSGRRMMPSFRHLSDEVKNAVAAVLLDDKSSANKIFPAQPVDTFLQLPYGITGYNKFLSKEGYPAISPPWGTLNAINLNTGEIAWKIPLGEYPEFAKKGIITGTENYGGPVVTAGGVVFIAATRDSKIRAFDKKTGKQLWEYLLPAPGFATPAVYALNGKQYLVIACGGGKLGTKSGDSYIAFALPD